MHNVLDLQVSDIEPLQLSDFVRLDDVLLTELSRYIGKADIAESVASQIEDPLDRDWSLNQAKEYRSRAYELADVLLMIRQHYIVHPEDPHDLL